MNRNKILNVAHATCNILRVALLIIFTAYTVMFVHWHINPVAYEQVKLGDTLGNIGKASSSVSSEKVSFTYLDVKTSNANTDVSEIFTIGNLNYISFYLFFMQIVAYTFLLYYILKEIQNIIKSVQEFNSFRLRNVDSFKKIGLYCFLLFLTTSFLFAETADAAFVGFYFSFTPLLFMLASYVLAEIFREGNKLYEEQQLTV